ncbi:hypothetical protein KVT40_000205 [Elsinoe batatas]|uniref:Uncharacterized protein n=1 Tax=Elsinoe batatas TaxID=2601811 RepID=A0A8K0PG79_9PEZI|nr:hypothetical protein KVT40_000205 [Elsinoe batatas]
MSTPSPTAMPVGGGMPSGAIPAAICVLIYSFICWTCGVLLITTLFLNKERWSYVLLFSISTTCSSTVSITQQIFYMVHWAQSRQEAFEASIAAAKNPALALGPLSKGFSSVTCWIQVFFFNVDALLMLFWAVALTVSVWDWRIKGLYNHYHKIGLVSKVAAFVLPALVASLRASTKISIRFGPGFFLTSCLLLLSFTFGAVAVTLILVKYVRTRLGFSSYASGSVEIGEIPSTNDSRAVSRGGHSRVKVRVDPWLVLRFTIAFVILSGFNIFLVLYGITRYKKILRDGSDTSPDFSAKRAIVDVLNYIPPVTASLLAFLLFGTTSQARAKIATIFGKGRCWGRGRRISMPRPVLGVRTRDWDPLRGEPGDGASSLTKSPTYESHEIARMATPDIWTAAAKSPTAEVYELQEHTRREAYRPTVPEKDDTPTREDLYFQRSRSPI